MSDFPNLSDLLCLAAQQPIESLSNYEALGDAESTLEDLLRRVQERRAQMITEGFR